MTTTKYAFVFCTLIMHSYAANSYNYSYSYSFADTRACRYTETWILLQTVEVLSGIS